MLPRYQALLLALSLALPYPSAHAQYKWIDRDGQVGYGDQPPGDARSIQRMVSAPVDSIDPLATLPFEIRRAARDFPVVLYTRNDCAPCDNGRTYLKNHSVPFSERRVVTAEDIEAFRKLGGGDLLPAVRVGKQLTGGFDAIAWADLLAVAGYPQGVPLPRNWQWAPATALAPAQPAASAPDTSSGTPPDNGR